jgi:hypothetical protein
MGRYRGVAAQCPPTPEVCCAHLPCRRRAHCLGPCSSAATAGTPHSTPPRLPRALGPWTACWCAPQLRHVTGSIGRHLRSCPSHIVRDGHLEFRIPLLIAAHILHQRILHPFVWCPPTWILCRCPRSAPRPLGTAAVRLVATLIRELKAFPWILLSYPLQRRCPAPPALVPAAPCRTRLVHSTASQALVPVAGPVMLLLAPPGQAG